MDGILCILPARERELDWEHGSEYVTPKQKIRHAIDLGNHEVDAEKIKAVVRRGASQSARRQALASVCGWPVGPWADKTLAEVLAWPACKRELYRFGEEAVPKWSVRVPRFPVVRALVDSVLKADGIRDRWTGRAPGQADWDVEDYYVRLILQCIKALADNTKYARLASWIRKAPRGERIYIFFHIAMLIQYEIKFEKWRGLPLYARLAYCMSGQKRKSLYN